MWQFVTEEDFSHLPQCVAQKFTEKRKEMKEKLKIYQLDVYFLNDSERRGVGTIRMHIESFDFEKFSWRQRGTGGKYFAFCDIFKVCSFLSCK